MGPGCAIDWLPESVLATESLLYNRVNHAYLFEPSGDQLDGKCLAILDCSSFKNFASFEGFNCSLEDLSSENWGVPPDPIHNLQGYKNYLIQLVSFQIEITLKYLET